MRHVRKGRLETFPSKSVVVALLGVLVLLAAILGSSYFSPVVSFERSLVLAASSTINFPKAPVLPPLNKAEYDKKMWILANNGIPFASSTELFASTTAKKPKWPVRGAAYPKTEPLLPFNRIIAYYGNFYSTRMGILGEFDEATVLAKLRSQIAEWERADPTTPVVPAIEYIAITAQESPVDGTYRARMPHHQIDQAIEMAAKINGIVILDLQVGLSTLEKEMPLLEEYWKKPNVHVALDPEFSMKTGDRPGTVIGSFDAADINYTAQYLARLVQEHNLPPKILIIHRFTQAMVTNYKLIRPLPEVQMIMVMDGWGSPIRKIGTYQAFIQTEPVQFTGFKIFYKNDMRPPSTRLLSPSELLELTPRPIFVQYQ